MDTIGHQLLSASQEIVRLNAEVKRLREQLVITHSDLTDSIAENIKLREAIEKHMARRKMIRPITFCESDRELYAVLEQKCTCHMSHGKCAVHGNVLEQKTST
jgi:hypothetical protein